MWRLETSAGGVITRRLEAFNDKERCYSYSIMQAPLPATAYLSTIRVQASADQHSLVEWSGSFTPVGVSHGEVTRLFRGIYEGGLEALGQRFGRLST